MLNPIESIQGYYSVQIKEKNTFYKLMNTKGNQEVIKIQ